VLRSEALLRRAASPPCKIYPQGAGTSKIMKFPLRFVFVVFYFTAVLIFTAYLRAAGNHVFYKLWSISSEQSRLKQQLWQKQLELESLINPAAVSERLGE